MGQRTLLRGYHYPLQTYLDTHAAGGFTQLSLDLTAQCNYACDWCFNQHLLNQDEGMLSLSERLRVLHEAKSLGAKAVSIPGTGEPTLDPDLDKVIKESHKLELSSVVY